MTSRKKITISTSIILAVIILILSGFFITYNYLKTSYDEEINGEVLSNTIITRAENGIPLITASSRDDIFYALGYIHAQDRLNIMEYQRALATGTLNQFMNNHDSVLLDRLASIIGFTLEAEKLYEKLEPEIKNNIKIYTKGINHIRHTKRLAKTGKRDWTPSDVLAILIMKEWTESFLTNPELLFTFSDSKKTILSRVFRTDNNFYYYKEEDTPYIYILQRVRTLLEKYAGQFNCGFAAYINSDLNSEDNRNFTSFSYTANYGIYPGWYPVNFKIKDSIVSAITYNGLPFFFTFKKGTTFFAHFTINTDTQNFTLFKTKKNNNSYQYYIKGYWKEFTPVRIPDGINTSMHTLRWTTDKGVILSDLIISEKENNQILCINSALPGPNYLKIITNAPFEVDNNSALKRILSSSDSSLKGFIVHTDKESFKVYSGFVASANTKRDVVTNGSVYAQPDLKKISIIKKINGIDFIGSDITTTKDIHSINTEKFITNAIKLKKLSALLPYKKIYTEQSVRSIIRDTHSGAAELFIPLFRQILNSAPLTSAKMTKIYFNEWDFTTRNKMQAPSIFYTTLLYLIEETFKDELKSETESLLKYSHLFYDKFYHIFDKNLSNIFDDTGTDQIETRESIFDRAFLKSMRYLNRKNGPLMDKWKWGEINKNYYRIPNVTSSIYTRIYKLNEIPDNGAPDTLYYTSLDRNLKPVAATALTGLMTDDKFCFRMNFTYSSSVLSDFYYGKDYKIKTNDSQKEKISYKTVIQPF
ncbi:MAG TPA: penicillin acylase family protein [Spirochaetota bacterium]|nr:penicillin acylase family protein [Spirochaetota bacterium]